MLRKLHFWIGIVLGASLFNSVMYFISDWVPLISLNWEAISAISNFALVAAALAGIFFAGQIEFYKSKHQFNASLSSVVESVKDDLNFAADDRAKVGQILIEWLDSCNEEDVDECRDLRFKLNEFFVQILDESQRKTIESMPDQKRLTEFKDDAIKYRNVHKIYFLKKLESDYYRSLFNLRRYANNGVSMMGKIGAIRKDAQCAWLKASSRKQKFRSLLSAIVLESEQHQVHNKSLVNIFKRQ